MIKTFDTEGLCELYFHVAWRKNDGYNKVETKCCIIS